MRSDQNANTIAGDENNNGRQKLMHAQDEAMEKPEYQPGYAKSTHCNQATFDVADAMGAPMDALSDKNGKALLAEKIRANLADEKCDSGYREVSADEAQELANSGKLVILTGPGHVATVRPETESQKSGKWPLIANVGAKNEINTLNYVFKPDVRNQVRYYTPE